MADHAKGGLLSRFSKKLRENKKLELLVYGLIILAVLLLYLSTLLPGKQSGAQPDPVTLGSAATGQQDVEARLQEVLSSIRGAGQVEVMITYETGPELVPAMSTDVNSNTSETTGGSGSTSSQRTESSRPATVSGSDGTQPIVLTEKQPEVRGVIVVAEGAADIMVMLDLQRAVQTVLNVPASCIEVFERARIE